MIWSFNIWLVLTSAIEMHAGWHYAPCSPDTPVQKQHFSVDVISLITLIATEKGEEKAR
jgi:hypothetical protein